MEKQRITVFTPTYNRGKLLKRVYASLVKQGNFNFIWMIVDDGSTDDTKNIIDDMKKKSPFKIEYFYKNNGGKHTAFNFAVKKCNTDYFFILDSDDYLSDDAINILYSYISIVDDNASLSGILGYKHYENGDIVGNKFPSVKYLSGIELYQKYKFKGETSRLYKTNILKNYKFPEIENEKFIYENLVFDAIDSKYKFLLINDLIYYVIYQNDGYSANSSLLCRNNPIGYSMSLNCKSKYSIKLKYKIGFMCLYIIWCKKYLISNIIRNSSNKFLCIFCYPIAYFLNLIKKPVFFFNIMRGD